MKKTILLLTLVVVLLGISLAYSIRLNVLYKDDDFQGMILRKMDQSSLSRMNTLYERFLNHKDDYLMIIGPNIDSGPIITNINSNGKDIVWINDTSRDVFTNGSVEVYKCRQLNKSEEKSGTIFSVSKCQGYSEDEIKGSIEFPKSK
ncbi:DUF4362 domain-containing protein [Paenibacillus glycanilyticus]|uniref:DUF4362 domain-containing protein n=1 Tax=Paenibacillus glycanilyticus TaxID=126569 RepID=UPI00203D2018|nr:DUF4362 domain-containing protein [Paenibacillus glycanilyticus]MCM3626758.1 DUF4362 domain-containing protein [Paenibacillus glycanilyticus]